MFLPPTIDLGNSEKYTLSMRIQPEGFMFSLSIPNEGRNYCLRGTRFQEGSVSLLDNIKKIIFDLNFLTQQYSKTNVVLVSPQYSIIPSEYYNSKKKEELFGFTHFEENDLILTNPIPRYDVDSLFMMNEDVYEFLSRSLYNPHFYNHSTLLIDLFEGRAKTMSLHSKMYVNLHDDFMDIICFGSNELLHSVSFTGLAENEKTYYILKIWESLNLNQMTDQLLIAGELEQSVLIILREYVKNIERVASPSEIYLWHKDAQKAPLDLIYLSL